MQTDLVQLVLQAGGVGIGLYAVYALYTLSSNHVDHNTQVLAELKDAINKLIEFLENHHV